uniref:Peptidoglycan glycosyltransferase n=1 Tax=Parastrongyloides trichosuri TaxID=131310 RepID=A0A0N4Z1H6_PARTI
MHDATRASGAAAGDRGDSRLRAVDQAGGDAAGSAGAGRLAHGARGLWRRPAGSHDRQDDPPGGAGPPRNPLQSIRRQSAPGREALPGDRRARRTRGPGGGPVRLSPPDGDLARRAAAEPGNSRLWPPVVARRLFHHRHPARPVPRLSAGAADPAGDRIRRDLRRGAVGSGNPLPLCAGWFGRGAGQHHDGGHRPLVPDHGPGPHRRRDLRRPVRAGRRASAGPVRRPAHRLLAGPAAALHRHPGRGRAALHPVHQLPSLRRRVRPVLRRGRGGDARHRRSGGGHHGRRLAQASDARLSPDAAGRSGHHPGQYRRRPVQRQDHHRPPGGAAPARLADDRPLRRPARQPDHRRLRPGPRLSARRPRAGRGPARRHPHPQHRRGAACPLRCDQAGLGRAGRRGEEAPAHRHRRHHRRPQLGAALFQVGPALQPEPRRRHRHGKRHHRRPGLSLPRALRDAAVRVGQAAARRDQAAGPGQPFLRRLDLRAFADRYSGGGPAAGRGRAPALAQAARVRRAAFPVRGRYRSPRGGSLLERRRGASPSPSWGGRLRPLGRSRVGAARLLIKLRGALRSYRRALPTRSPLRCDHPPHEGEGEARVCFQERTLQHKVLGSSSASQAGRDAMTRDQVQSVHDDIAYMKALAQEGRHAPLLGGRILIIAGLVFGVAALA